MEFIEKHLDKNWDWSVIIKNLMTKAKEKFILQKYREHLAAFKIQQYYMLAKYTPTFAYCRKLHMMYYDENLK